MLMTLRSCRPTIGLIPTSAAVSIILLAGKQKTCSTPSRRNTSATAWLAFMPRSLQVLNSFLHTFVGVGTPERMPGGLPAQRHDVQRIAGRAVLADHDPQRVDLDLSDRWRARHEGIG